jgi:hypothetical protein
MSPLRKAVATLGIAFALTTAAPAQADYTGGTTPSVTAEHRTVGSAPVVSQNAESDLPITGSDLAGLAAFGALSLGVGIVVVVKTTGRKSLDTQK